MFCRNCGKPMNDGDRFCVHCGTAALPIQQSPKVETPPPAVQASEFYAPPTPPTYEQAHYQQPFYQQIPYGQAPYGQAPYGQAPYGQAPYGQASVTPSPEKQQKLSRFILTFGIISLCCSVTSIFLFLSLFLMLLTSASHFAIGIATMLCALACPFVLVGLVFGNIARNKANDLYDLSKAPLNSSAQTGKGLATAGRIVAIVALPFVTLFLLIVFTALFA